MSNRTSFLIFGRHIHDGLREMIEHGDRSISTNWVTERHLFEHDVCGLYLLGCLAYLEGKYGTQPWNSSTHYQIDFDIFLSSTHISDKQKKNFSKYNISKQKLEALYKFTTYETNQRGLNNY